MDVAAVAVGIGAMCTSAGGTVIVVREFRRRERREMKHDLDEMISDQRVLTGDLLACRRYAFALQELLAERGIEHPPPPIFGRPPSDDD